MEFKYYLQELSAADARSDEEAIMRFPCVVKSIAREIECRVTQLDDENIKAFEAAIGDAQDIHDFDGSVPDILVGDQLGPIPRLVVCCDADSALASMGKSELPHAKWGFSCNWFTAIYHHEPATVWHEMLHLTGAEDCYKDGGAKDKTCGHDNCIMQYAPTVGVVGDPPFLCEENVQRIGDTWEQYCKRRAAGGGA